MLDYLTRRVGSQVAADLVADTFERAFLIVRVPRMRMARRCHGVRDCRESGAHHRRTEARRLRALAREARSQRSAAPDTSRRTWADPVLLEALAGLTQPLREVLLLHAWASSPTRKSPWHLDSRPRRCAPVCTGTRPCCSADRAASPAAEAPTASAAPQTPKRKEAM